MTASVHELRSPDAKRQRLLEDIRQVVGSEIMTAQLIGPRDAPPMPPVDLDAERCVLAMVREGHLVDIPADEWGSGLHQLVYVAMRCAWQRGMEPTTDTVMMILKDSGYTESVRPWVVDALDGTPYRSTPRELAARLHRAAQARRLIEVLTHAIAVLRCPTWDRADVFRDLRAAWMVLRG